MPDRSYLRWPFLDDEHRTLADDLQAWAAAEIAGLEEPAASDEALDAHCRDLVTRLADGGWLAAATGEPIDVRTLCLTRETLAYHHALADFAFAMQGLGSGAISLFGSDDLRLRYLPGVADGGLVAAFALSEPEAGSDVAQIAMTARRGGSGDYVLDGEKTWISNGGLADVYTVFARTGEAPGAPSICSAGTRTPSNASRASGCGATTGMRSATRRPDVPASTTNALRPRAPGASPVRAKTV